MDGLGIEAKIFEAVYLPFSPGVEVLSPKREAHSTTIAAPKPVCRYFL